MPVALKCKLIWVVLEVLVKCFTEWENKVLQDCCCLLSNSAAHVWGNLSFLRSHRRLGRRKERRRNTLGLSCRAVGIPQGQKRGLHQLAKKHIFSHQDELGVFFSVVIFKRAIQLLHHTEDRNHQTCEDTIQQQKHGCYKAIRTTRTRAKAAVRASQLGSGIGWDEQA